MSRHPNHLRSCRRKAGLTQVQLAAIAGHETAFRVSTLENGRVLPNVRECLLFEQLFGRSFPELWPQVAAETRREGDVKIRTALAEFGRQEGRSHRKRRRAEYLQRRLERVVSAPIEED